MKKPLYLAGLLLLASASSFAEITVKDAYARATAPSATTSAIFMTLSNSDDQDKVLTSATASKAGHVELHDVITEGDVMKMRQVANIVVPSHGDVKLQPGGYHIMLFDLDGALVEGDKMEVHLNFEDQTTVELIVPIEKVQVGMAMKSHDHILH